MVAAAFVIAMLTGCSFETSSTAEEKVTGMVTGYIKALESRDIPAMVKYADDIGFPDKKVQRLEYEQILKSEMK